MKTETQAIPKGHTIPDTPQSGARRSAGEALPIDRYIAIDIHKHYVLLGV